MSLGGWVAPAGIAFAGYGVWLASVTTLMAEPMGELGAAVTPVESAELAFKSLLVSAPDLILSDIRMPDEDGYSLIRRIRAHERQMSGTAIPAVALTAFAGDLDRQKALAAGFNEHLKKPAEPLQVVRVLHALIHPK